MRRQSLAGFTADGNPSLERRIAKYETTLKKERESHLQTRNALRRKEQEAALLLEIGRTINSSLDLGEVAEHIAILASEATGLDCCYIFLLDESTEQVILVGTNDALSREHIGQIRLNLGQGITGWAAQSKEMVVIREDSHLDPRYEYFPETKEERFASFLSLPLLSAQPDHKVLGMLNLRGVKPTDFTPDVVDTVRLIAHQVTAAIENAKLYAATKKHLDELRTLEELSRGIIANQYPEETLQLIVDLAAPAMKVPVCSLVLLDERQTEPVTQVTYHQGSDSLPAAIEPLSRWALARVLAEKKPVVVREFSVAGEHGRVALDEGLGSLLCVSLVCRGRTLGALCCFDARPRDFKDAEIRLFTTLANQAAVAIDDSQLWLQSVILKEIQHRVKNNLQTISSYLKLELNWGDKRSREKSLLDSIYRVDSMAVVHDMLTQRKHTDLRLYDLCCRLARLTSQQQICGAEMEEIPVEGPQSLILPAGKVSSCAAVIAELLHNAVEHGGNGHDRPRPSLSFGQDHTHAWISICNLGRCTPSRRGLGLTIVEALVNDDLRGAFTLRSDGEKTVALVSFPVA